MICYVFLVAPLLVIAKVFVVYYIGIISRAILEIWCVFNLTSEDIIFDAHTFKVQIHKTIIPLNK